MTNKVDPDTSVREKISALVAREHEIREQLHQGDDEQRDTRRAALSHVEEMLDQCWDLLRQRQALRENRQNPAGARARTAAQVENYLQ